MARRRVPRARSTSRPATAPRSGPARRRRGWTRSRWPTTRSASPCAPTSRRTGPSSTRWRPAGHPSPGSTSPSRPTVSSTPPTARRPTGERRSECPRLEDEIGAGAPHPEVGVVAPKCAAEQGETIRARRAGGRLDGLATMSRGGAGRRRRPTFSTSDAPRQGDHQSVRSLLRVFTQQPLAAKVPEVTVMFWVIKISTTAAGEAISDMFVTGTSSSASSSRSSVFVVALILQFAPGATSRPAYWFLAWPSRRPGRGSPTRCTWSSACPTP